MKPKDDIQKTYEAILQDGSILPDCIKFVEDELVFEVESADQTQIGIYNVTLKTSFTDYPDWPEFSLNIDLEIQDGFKPIFDLLETDNPKLESITAENNTVETGSISSNSTE